MISKFVLALAMTVPVLSGCLDAADGGETASTMSAGGPRIVMGEQTVEGNAPLFFAGSELMERQREQFVFDVEFPEGYWDDHTGGLEVSIMWPYTYWEQENWVWFDLAVFAEDSSIGDVGNWGSLAQTVMLDEPTSGRYLIQVNSYGGVGSYDGVVQLESRPNENGPVRDLLPNLVTLAPSDLKIEYPGDSVYMPLPLPVPIGVPEEAAQEMLDARGCYTLEIAEYQSNRCLRFANYIGNAGEGPFQIVLNQEQELLSYAQSGQWTQRVYRTDGTWHDEPVGVAAYHLSHEHHHYQGMAEFLIYYYDEATGQRGDLLNEGRKTGFWFADIGMVELGLTGTMTPWSCYELSPWPEDDGWGSCLSPSWYDLYTRWMVDQYVDIGAAPDGTYELVSRSNGIGSALETDLMDNEASTIFRLSGDAIEILSQSTEFAGV